MKSHQSTSWLLSLRSLVLAVSFGLLSMVSAAYCQSDSATQRHTNKPFLGRGTATDLSIRGAGRLFPIALPQLCVRDGTSSAGKTIPEVMARNLNISGFFEVLNPGAYIETQGKCAPRGEFAYSDWTVIGAEGLVRGEVSETPTGIKVTLLLYDVLRQQMVLGKEYEGDEGLISTIAHKFSNEIMRFFTGEYGVFGTRIAFSSKVGRFKELFIMDMDGSNVRQLTNERGLAISAAWSANGEQLVYTSYRRRVPDIFAYSLSSGDSRQVTRGAALEVGPEFSRDAESVLASQSNNGESDIVLFDRKGRLLRNLTRGNGALDVSPTWSPDEQEIAFVSNRSGGPQIYRMRRDGKQVERVSFVRSNYCTSPSWSAAASKIAFVCRADRGFQLFTARPDGSGAMQLTSVGSNEDPSWSPDGRYLVFSSNSAGGGSYNLMLVMADGSNLRQLTNSRNSDSQPAWGPRLF